MKITKTCNTCGNLFEIPWKQRKQRFCGHKCAFVFVGPIARAAAFTPEAIAKRGNVLRGRGAGLSYIKRNGRHEHRLVAEEKMGRPLLPGEISHHIDENKRNNHPDNLEVLSSQSEHARLHFTGMKRLLKTHCKFGHLFTKDNILITSIKRRRCLICARECDKNWKREKRRRMRNENHPLAG